MPLHNVDIAETFRKVADLLEIEAANEFRVRACRNAAGTITSLPQDVSTLIADGQDLSQLPGIGGDLAGKIAELVNTGTMEALDEIETRAPPGLSDMIRVPGLGPKMVKALHDALGIDIRTQPQFPAGHRRLHGILLAPIWCRDVVLSMTALIRPIKYRSDTSPGRFGGATSGASGISIKKHGGDHLIAAVHYTNVCTHYAHHSRRSRDRFIDSYQ